MRYYILVILVILFLLPSLLFVKREFMDKPDLIIVLAGGEGEYRLKKALDYYKKNIPKSNILIYTGGDFTFLKTSPSYSRRFYFENNGIKASNIIHIEHVKNTMDEMKFLKKFMIVNSFKKATIISDSYHSYRISFYTKYLLDYKKYNLSINIENSEYSDKHYFRNILYNFFEIIKLYYNIIKYSIVLKFFHF